MPPKIPGVAAAAAFLLRRAQLLLFSTTTTAQAPARGKRTPPPTSHSMTEYLVSNCGFTASDAAKHSQRFSHLKSHDKPDAALGFLRRLGLDAASIRKVISSIPLILNSSVTKTLEPKLIHFRAAGFSDTDIADIVVSCPRILQVNFRSKLQLLGAYLPSKDDLLKAVRRNGSLLLSNLNNSVMPNAALLLAHGMAERDIARALMSGYRLLTRNPSSFKELLDRVVGLGFPTGTTSFLSALCVLNQLSKETLRGKIDTMKSFGWSEEEFHGAFRKYPRIMVLSVETLRTKMRFLVVEARLEPGYIAERPALLSCSLEKVLVPRHRVLQILKAEGLPGSQFALFSAATLREGRFLKTCVLPYLDSVPAIREIYPNAGARDAKIGVSCGRSSQ